MEFTRAVDITLDGFGSGRVEDVDVDRLEERTDSKEVMVLSWVESSVTIKETGAGTEVSAKVAGLIAGERGVEDLTDSIVSGTGFTAAETFCLDDV